jgi:hypothetical protein
MLVRVTTGWKAGQIQDIEPSAARAMVADGRATVVSYDPEPSGDLAIGSSGDLEPAAVQSPDGPITRSPDQETKAAKKKR